MYQALPFQNSQPPLTGEIMEQLPQLRIKDNVDHAGLSLPLLTLKDKMPSKTEA